MKKIIPFKKELDLKSNIYDILSISLEHSVKVKETDLISGEFYITGEYKISETSFTKEPFDFTLPFDIALDSRYNTDNMIIDIDDFYYEVIDNKILKVNIDLYLDGEIEERCIEKEEVEDIEEVELPEENKNKNIILEIGENMDNDNLKEVEKRNEDININIDNINDNINMFDNFNVDETYATYHVYMVKEDDTVDSIIKKYEITKEELENYNTITDIKVGDKLIIPCPKNE